LAGGVIELSPWRPSGSRRSRWSRPWLRSCSRSSARFGSSRCRSATSEPTKAPWPVAALASLDAW